MKSGHRLLTTLKQPIQMLLLPLLVVGVMSIPRAGSAAVCIAKTLADIKQDLADIQKDSMNCNDAAGFPTIRISPDLADPANKIIKLDAPLVVDVPVHIMSNADSTKPLENIQLVSNLPVGSNAGCLITLARSGTILEKVSIINPKASPATVPALRAICTEEGTKNITIKNSIILSPADGVTGINLAGFEQIVVGNTISLRDGIGVSISGDRATVETNTITVLSGTGVDIAGLTPKVSGNRIFGDAMIPLIFKNPPLLKKSDAANIAMSNVSFALIPNTNQFGLETIPARSNFVAFYNDATPFPKCPVFVVGGLPYKPHLDTLECNIDITKIILLPKPGAAAPMPEKTCSADMELKDGNCVPKATVEDPYTAKDKDLDAKTPEPGAQPQFTIPDFNPIVAHPADSSAGCSLVPEQAVSALTPVSVFLITIGLTGFTAYRSSLKNKHARRKK